MFKTYYTKTRERVIISPPRSMFLKNKWRSHRTAKCTLTAMGVDPGGGGGDGGYIPPPPPHILGGGGLYYHPPNISRYNVILYRQNIWSTNKIMKETAGFECRNAKIFLARIHRLSRCGRLAGSLWCVFSAMSLVRKLHRMYVTK